MRWNGEAEEALTRLIEGADARARLRSESDVRSRVEARAREEGVEEIGSELVVSTILRAADPADHERIRRAMRSLDMRPDRFSGDFR